MALKKDQNRKNIQNTRENQRKRKAAIDALMEDKGLSRKAATLIYDGGSVVTTFDGDNVEQAKIVRREIEGSGFRGKNKKYETCLLYTSPSPRDRTRSRMPSSA